MDKKVTNIVSEFTNCYKEFEKLGIINHKINLSRSKISFLEMIINFVKILFLVVKVRPDIFHLITVKPIIIGGLVARLLIFPSVVYSISGLGIAFSNNSILGPLKSCIFKFIYGISLNHKKSKIIVQTLNDQKILNKIIKNESKFILLKGSGVDLKKFIYKPLPTSKTTILFAGRMLKDKGVFEFIQSAKNVISQGYNAKFVLAGNEDRYNPVSVKNFDLEKWHNEGLVEWLGYKEDMAQVISKSHIVVFPSFYGEGIPKILIEAAACGRCIITTDWPGCRDAIEEGVTGILVPIKNVDHLTDAIIYLLNNPNLIKKLGALGRQRAESLFSIDKIIDNHLQLYSSLLEEL